jgi:SMI1 / KNR4 family (SUKH-1)
LPYFDPTFIQMICDHEDTDVDGGATDEQIETAQSKAGFEFPLSYTEFLHHFNGGSISWIQLWGVGRSDYLDLFKNLYDCSDIPPIGARYMFPFANDWGGSLFCFDVLNGKQSGEYGIYYWNHEYSEEIEYAPYVWEQQSTSFVDFIRNLYQ